MKINLLPAVGGLLFLLSCNHEDAVEKTLECNAEKAGQKWIIIPKYKSDAWITLRRIDSGEFFRIFTPDKVLEFRANRSGWKKFASIGSFEWTGKNPDLICHEDSIWFQTGVVDDPPCNQ
jgi:hypothetical protein